MQLVDFLSELRFEWLYLALAVLWTLLIIPLLIVLYYRRGRTARVRFSSLRHVKSAPPSLRVRLRHLPFWLRILGVFVMLAALAHPFLEREKKMEKKELGQEEKQEKNAEERKKIEVPTEGISIQLLIDRSGSMGPQSRTDLFGNPTGGEIGFVRFEGDLYTKLDVVKIISQRFIKGTKETTARDPDSIFTGRSNDMIGLFTFARYPFVACPLTLRHDLLLDYISQLKPVTREEENGTYIGYALQRCNLQIIDAKSRAEEEDAYNIKSSIIILITDGMQVIRPEDQADKHKSLSPSEAAKIAKEHGIKVYTVAVSPRVIYDENGTALDPRMLRRMQFDTSELKTVALLTGGKFYNATSAKALVGIYDDINQLETSKLPAKKELEALVEKTKESQKIETEKIELFVPLLWLGLLLLLAEVFCAEFYLRRIP